MPRVKYLKVKDGKRLGIGRFPNIHKSGSASGMKRLFGGKPRLLCAVVVMSTRLMS